MDTQTDPRGELPPGLMPLRPAKKLDRIHLDADSRSVIDKFLVEQVERDLLIAGGIEPRHKMMMVGPPGNGKTALAGALALELGVPSFTVRYDDLIAKEPGETSRRLLAMFKWAEQIPTLLFFDEFDAIGRERGNEQESGEMKRVVSTLLVQFDAIPSHVICIAATNHDGMIDSAMHRRFNIRLDLPKPPLEVFPQFMREMFRNYKHEPREGEDYAGGDVDYELVVLRTALENLSDAELFCKNAVRGFILSKGALTIEASIQREVVEWGEKQKRRAL